MTEDGFGDRMLTSARDALNPFRILIKILIGLLMVVLTAIPYIIKNLDQVWVNAQQAGVTGTGNLLLRYLWALWLAVKKGYLLGLSTLWDAIIHFGDVFGEVKVGTIIVILVIFAGALISLHQVTSFIFNVLDAKKGRAYPKLLAWFASAFVVLLILAPLAYLSQGGETVTSGITTDPIFDVPDVSGNETINGENLSLDSDIPIIDLGEGGS